MQTHSDVESRDGKLVLTSVVEDLVDVLAGDDTSGNNVENTHSVVTKERANSSQYGCSVARERYRDVV